ncbi:putative Embryonic protein UVS.2 [Hypsibius exemplaris]|uniref:Metalloendopeptidase n=1 Tax=Hypsibius exemplaris TaxID=2072580 RepID=A0A9X6NHD1_HYPEX|nr:putative Embryonic protein UVS.2 [Hypsibius exemplaris]
MLCIALLALVGLTAAVPAFKHSHGTRLGSSAVDAFKTNDTQIGKQGFLDQNLLWTGGIVPYVFSKTFLNEDIERMLVLKAMQGIENATCVRFVQRTNEQNYLQIFADPFRCYSSYGRQVSSPNGQRIGLSISNCFPNGSIGITQHELMFALGFHNEELRLDRDEYVDINWTNIKAANRDLFQKRPSTAFGEPYDFGSILHYGMFDFAIDPTVWTIKPKEKYGDRKIGQREQLSAIDINKINKMYNCDGSAPIKVA